jgi:hypothetical protein
MLANAKLNDWNRNRILHQQSSRSFKSLAKMRAKAMRLNQKAMSPEQYRQFHLQYAMKHSHEHPEETKEEFQIRVAAHCREREIDNAQFRNQRDRSRSRDSNKKAIRKAREILGNGYESEGDFEEEPKGGQTPPPDDEESEGDDGPTVSTLLDAINKQNAVIADLVRQRDAAALIVPPKSDQIIRIVNLSDGKCRIDKVVNQYTISKLKAAFDNRVFADHNKVRDHLSENAKELINLAMINNGICENFSWLNMENDTLLPILTHLYPIEGTINSTALEKFRGIKICWDPTKKVLQQESITNVSEIVSSLTAEELGSATTTKECIALLMSACPKNSESGIKTKFMNGMEKITTFHQFKQHYSRLWFEYEKGVDSLKTYGMSIVDNKRKHAGDEPNTPGSNKSNPKIIDNSNKNGGKEHGLGKKERREKNNRDKGDRDKCFRCNRFLTTADRCKEGQTPHTAENCFLKDHPDANKDPSKMYSDTKAFHELKKKFPNHNFISPNITSSGEDWSCPGQKGKRSDNNSAGKAGGKKNGEFNLCANINDDSSSDFLSCYISTFQEKVATNGGSAGPVGIFKILALLDQGSLAGSGDFISEATVDRMNASNFITFIDNQKLVCAGVDTNACYAPKGNIKI